MVLRQISAGLILAAALLSTGCFCWRPWCCNRWERPCGCDCGNTCCSSPVVNPSFGEPLHPIPAPKPVSPGNP